MGYDTVWDREKTWQEKDLENQLKKERKKIKKLEKQLRLNVVGSRSIWMVQDVDTLVVYGVFTTQDKAINYSNDSNRIVITKRRLLTAVTDIK